MKKLTIILLLTVLSLAPVRAQTLPDVAVLAADPLNLNDVVSNVQSTGLFGNVVGIDTSMGTPDLDTLRQYAAILIYYSDFPADPTGLGNVVAAFLEGGGGVVIAQFALAASPFTLGGDFAGKNYYAIQPTQVLINGPQSLGQVFGPTHPIMQGIANLNGGDASYRPVAGSVHPDAVKIADWSDGSPLVAGREIDISNNNALNQRNALNVNTAISIGLGFFPVSSNGDPGSFDPATTDFIQLIAQALLYACGNTGPPPSNNPPELDSIPNQTMKEGEELSLTVSASDPEGNNITLTARVSTGEGELDPAFITFDTITGTFTFKPNFENAGEYFLEVTATDDGDPPLSDIETFTLTVENVQSNSAANGDNQNANDADPVNLFTGELFNQEPRDINLGGPLALLFERYYAAFMSRDGFIAGTLGNNWLHNFDWRLTLLSANFIQITSDRGRLILFEKIADDWQLREQLNIPFQLVQSNTDFILSDPRSKRLLTFDASGKLLTIADGKGNAHTLSYNGQQLTTVSDGLGRTLTFAYDASDHLISVSDGTRTIIFTYTGDNLTSSTDAEGNVTTYDYTASASVAGLLTAKTRPLGNAPFAQSYDLDAQVATQTDGNSNLFQFMYNAGDATLTNPLADTRQYSHDENGLNLVFTDEAGKQVIYGYDDSGRRDSITDRLGNTTTFEFHGPSGNIAAINNADGSRIEFSYSARVIGGAVLFDLIGIAYPDGTSESFSYDAAGNIINRTDRDGKVSTFTYNNRGQVLTATNPEAGVRTFVYNADGTLLSVQDASGNTTTFGYDAFKRRILITRADGTTRSFSYDDRDLVLTVTDERGNTTTLGYDINGNLISRTDALGQLRTFAYDAMDQLIRFTDALGNVITYTYDPLNRVNTVTDANGNTRGFNYDARGRRSATIDGEGNSFATIFNDEAIRVSASDPLGNTTTFTPDLLGRIVEITSPVAGQTQIARDVMGRSTANQDALGQTTTTAYDNRGLASSQTLATGASSTYTRNDLGQITQASDPNGNLWSLNRDAQGRLTATVDPLLNTTTYDYDPRNRVDNLVLAGGLGTLAFAYDGTNNVTQRQYSDGVDLNYSYDELNRLTAAEGVSLAYDANSRIIESNGITMVRDAGGRIISITLAPGKTVTYSYDRRDLITQVTDWLGGITTFNYDAAGRRVQTTRPNGVTSTYSYDAESRIINIVETGPPAATTLQTITITRDALGQMTDAERLLPQPAGPTTPATTAHTFDAASQIGEFSYDALGRLTDDGARTYTWDLANRLTGYENGSSVSFGYDGFGNRTSRSTNGSTRTHVWNYGLALPNVAIVREQGIDQTYYIHTPDGLLLYGLTAGDGSRQFYHYDEVGSTVYLTDDAGMVIATYAYTPFGGLLNATGSVDNPFTFLGQYGIQQEGETGLYYMRARYYDSTSARFISRDPIRSVDPRRINPYQYVLGNPLRFVDPPVLEAEGLTIRVGQALAFPSSTDKTNCNGNISSKGNNPTNLSTPIKPKCGSGGSLIEGLLFLASLFTDDPGNPFVFLNEKPAVKIRESLVEDLHGLRTEFLQTKDASTRNSIIKRITSKVEELNDLDCRRNFNINDFLSHFLNPNSKPGGFDSGDGLSGGSTGGAGVDEDLGEPNPGQCVL